MKIEKKNSLPSRTEVAVYDVANRCANNSSLAACYFSTMGSDLDAKLRCDLSLRSIKLGPSTI